MTDIENDEGGVKITDRAARCPIIMTYSYS
jgi:hypothetical protein